MDDILIAHENVQLLHQILLMLTQLLQNFGLIIAPDKIQQSPPYNYLGRIISTQTISHQNLKLQIDHLQTLNDFQKLLGDINWICPFLKLTTAELKP